MKKKLQNKEVEIQSEKTLLKHEYTQQILMKLRDEIKVVSLNLNKKLIKTELESTLQSVMLSGGNNMSNSYTSDGNTEVKHNIKISKEEEEWKLQSLLNAFKRCTPIRYVQENCNFDDASDIYFHINRYLEKSYDGLEKERKAKDKKIQAAKDQRSTEQTEMELKKLLSSYSLATPSTSKKYNSHKKIYELENLLFSKSIESSIHLLKAEQDDDDLERTLHMQVQVLKDENLLLKEELIHKGERLRKVNHLSDKETYATPAIKQWYIYCGLLPKGIHFTNSEKKFAKFCKVVETVYTKLFVGLQIFYVFYGYGLDFTTALVVAFAMQAQNFTFENKTRLIMCESIDAKEVLESKEQSQILHNMVKSRNVPLLKKFLKQIINPTTILLGGYPLYNLYTMGNYVGFGILLFVALFLQIFHTDRMVYGKFMTEFPMKKNAKEIENYIQMIHDVVMNENVNIKRTPDEMLRILEDNQKIFTHRMNERKKSLFYHPMNVFLGLVLTLLIVFSMVLRQRTENIVVEMLTYSFSLSISQIVGK
eukprot:g8993.t1